MVIKIVMVTFNFMTTAEVDVFLEFFIFFYDPTNGNLISGSSPFSKSSLYIWKLSIQVLLKPSLEKFEHNFASMWNECSCAVVWTFFCIAFFGDLEWKLTFSSLVATCWVFWFIGILSVIICFKNRIFLLHFSRESHMKIWSRRFFFT